MKQQDIGIDLGTTSIIIATEKQGVVFSQPSIGAVDTRTGSIVAVGDESPADGGTGPFLYRADPSAAGRRYPGSPHDP